MSLPADELAVRVERILDKRAGRHFGLAAGVRQGETRYTTARGRMGSDRPQAPDERTIYEIGSITKVFTATLLADLARDGLLALDDPVQDHLPPGVVIPKRGRPIALADLASHTSGLPRLPKGLLLRAFREWDNPYATFDADRLHAAIARTRPRRAPGKIKYSNYGAGLLGYLLERRAGESYEALVRNRIAAPLGLTDTSVHVPDEKLGRLAEGHNRRGRPVPHWDLGALAGAGALRSTVADLLRFLDLQLGAGPPRLAEVARSLREVRARRGAFGVGLGWLVLPVPGQRGPVVWHDGGTGGFRSVAGFVAESETAVVVLSSSARGVDNLGLEILKAISEPNVDNRGDRSS